MRAWTLVAVFLASNPWTSLGADEGPDDDPGRKRAETQQRFDFSRRKMGTIVRISVYSRAEARANAAADAAYARVDELNRLLSDYEPESEVSRLSRTAGSGRAVAASEPLFTVLRRSGEVWKRSGGAFDATVGPLVVLWRKSKRSGRLPDERTLAEARAAVGWQHVVLDPEKRTVELQRPNARLDLGGIAKGYVADEMLRVLREQGHGRAMIDAGGDLVLGDPPPGRNGWRIAVAGLGDPNAPDGAAEAIGDRVVELANAAIATSGDLYRFVEIDGVRYSHIVDPATGLGRTERTSVTVIAPNGTTADAYASAFSVLGPAAAVKLANGTRGVETRIGYLVDGEPSTVESRGFGTPAKHNHRENDSDERPGTAG